MATLICRVCGNEYEACRNAKRIDGVYRWQDVACSPEHGAVYLDLIIKSREKHHDAVVNDPIEQANAMLDEEYLDEFEDEYFDEESEYEDTEIEV